MLPYRPESSTLPSGFRFHYDERLKTPEPQSEPRQPSPPRQRGIKLRRRNVLNYSFDAPTENTTADVPLPTIEIPEIGEEDNLTNFTYQPTAGFLAPAYRSSPPKTPVPQMYTSMDEFDSKRPDWAMSREITPDERPCSALSNPSEYSDDSYFSSIRTSRHSDDGSYTSPEDELNDPFVFPPPKGKEVLNSDVRSKTRRHAHWSKDMSTHLWYTYQIYLQDSTVTPFRVGASGIPPEGVIVRVAREAKRSWKGPKKSKKTIEEDVTSPTIEMSFGSVDLGSDLIVKSGSNTPTERSPTYPSWPHSSVATRNHLRELCKKDSTSIHTHRHLQSRSPTPFTHNRAHSAGQASRFASTFSTKEFALSLTTSTSESMRPDGPLAQLSSSQLPQPVTPRPFSFDGFNEDPFIAQPTEQDSVVRPAARKLGPPFISRTFGPSSSSTLASFGRPSPPKHTQSDQPRLRSPVRFGQSRSTHSTGKRRAQNPLEDELSNSGITRPSILDDQLFGGPMESNKRRVRNRGFSLGDEVFRLPPSFSLPTMNVDHQPNNFNSAPRSLLPSATFEPAAAGSNTFPRRMLQPSVEFSGTDKIRRRQYNTVHHPRRSIESFDFGSGLSLQSKLSQIGERLAEIEEKREERGGASGSQ